MPKLVSCTFESDDMPHEVEVNVSEIFLFNLLKEFGGYLSQGNLHNMIGRILSRYHIPLAQVNTHCLTPLKNKLTRMWASWKSSKGSSGQRKLLHKFGKSSYILKLSHKTGSPTKRKLKTRCRSRET